MSKWKCVLKHGESKAKRTPYSANVSRDFLLRLLWHKQQPGQRSTTSEPDIRPACQNTDRFSQNTEVHCRVHKNLKLENLSYESSQFNNDFAILPSIAASGPLSSGSQTVIEQTYTGLGPRIRTFSLFVWVSLESDKLSTLPCKLSHDCHRVSGCMPTSDKIESKYVTKHFTHEATYTNHTIFKFTKYADTVPKIRRK